MVYVASLEHCQSALVTREKDAARQKDRFPRHPLAEGRISTATELSNYGIAEAYPSTLHSKACGFQEELERRGLQQPPQAVVGTEIPGDVGRISLGYGEEEKEEEEEEGLRTLSNGEGPNLEGNTRKAFALVASLKSCAKQKDPHLGSKLHADVLQSGLLQKNVFVGNALMNMFVKCSALEKAQEVFDQLIVRDVVSWNTLIGGYTQNGHGEQALSCFEHMQLGGVSPDAVTFVSLLKACGSVGAVDKGKELHAIIVRDTSLEKDMHVGTAIVDMYVKCGLLHKAQEVFEKLCVRNIVSWTSLIVGFAQHKQGEKAIRLFERMKSEAVSPNAMTFSCILTACSSVGAMDKGLQVHAEIVKEGLLEKNNVVGNSLVDMYCKLGLLERAQQVFDELLVRDVVLWNALITGYAQQDNGEEALTCLDQMRTEGIAPDVTTFASVVKACGNIGALRQGHELHAEIVMNGLLEMDIVIGTALIYMYAHCGMLEEVQDVFDEIPCHDVVSWTALIAGYAQNGHAEGALDRFEQMQNGGFFPNVVTFSCTLKACGSIRASSRGFAIHCKIVKEGWSDENIVVANALVDMYARCGLLSEAQYVFDRIQAKDVASWNALILAHSQEEHVERTLTLFEDMELKGFCPDVVTFFSILKSCGRVGAIHKGQDIHAMVARDGFTEGNIVVGTALVEMYANCGMLGEAEDVFDEQVNRDVVLWNTLLAGYAQLGKDAIVWRLFEKMLEEGHEPNVVTYSIMLTVLSHQGLVDKGPSQLELFNESYGVVPFTEHYTCMVDLLGRAGHVEEALAVIEGMHLSADLALWFTLLGACQKWGNVSKLGSWAFKHAVQLDKGEATSYIYMRNVL